ncbi:uncharacterized protein LOC21393739 [Morus notabilis]|uniref:uncharacterized protein LOC21393739 n=1 Tax=Morus notabilis TaxID=981085 RepID=UPI000CECF7CF|nr:uncharacterized protein LOC21393739 [Morus notabilis]
MRHVESLMLIPLSVENGGKVVDEEADQVGVGQGKLYSPAHALRIDNININMGVGGDMIRRNFGAIKERLLEKLSAAAVPADALDNARRMLESVLRDVTVAAHALSKDALHRIKTHLVDILPSLSPALTTKMVDDAEKEATAGAAEDDNNNNYNEEITEEASNDHQDSASTTPILLNKPSSKL